MTQEQVYLNEIFEKYLGSYLSAESLQLITARYGESIASQSKKIYDELMHCPVDWRTATMDSALTILASEIARKYGWLSERAKRNLNYAYLMNWK